MNSVRPDLPALARTRRTVAHPLLRFRLPAALLAVVIVVGITGYMLIDGWSLFDSFYMTIITISTVGYTELHPQSTAGRAFTSVLIVFGVGTMLFGFGVFAETLCPRIARTNWKPSITGMPISTMTQSGCASK